jgi:hypothetical protein
LVLMMMKVTTLAMAAFVALAPVSERVHAETRQARGETRLARVEYVGVKVTDDGRGGVTLVMSQGIAISLGGVQRDKTGRLVVQLLDYNGDIRKCVLSVGVGDTVTAANCRW